MSPSSQHSTPKGHKRSPSREIKNYDDINLHDMTTDDFEQVIQRFDTPKKYPGLDTFRTFIYSLNGSRLCLVVAVGLMLGLVITLPIIATLPMGNKHSNINSAKATLNSPTAPDVELSIEDSYICKSDRRSNEMPLHQNRFICSKNGRYVFGMSNDGKLMYRDNELDLVEVYYSGKHGDYFVLEADGTFIVKDKHDEVQWSKVNKFAMGYTDNCLENNPCPYLHLHDGGVLVINYIDEGGEWQTKNFKHTIDVGYP